MIAKRVIGIPGDLVLMKDGIVHVNGRVVEEPYATATRERMDYASMAMIWQLEYLEAYGDPARYFPTLGNWGPLRIPSGRYFVLGDSRDHSIDSRELGLVSADDIVGRVDRVLWSHDGTCCDPIALLSGVRWERIGYAPGN